MLGDTAVAVHPDDERYAHLVGKRIKLPLTGRTIPVVADAHVDPEFGTGAVKVTPAHDPNDFEIGRRHDLPSLTVMDERGVITAHGPFQGLDRFEARPAVVAALRAEGRIVAEKRPYVHSVGHCSRCKTTVEPRLSLQWWVKVGAAGQGRRRRGPRRPGQIHPPELAKRYFDWVDNLHDWCISRQLWWGHRIPVWYGPDGEVVCVGPDEEPPAGEGWTPGHRRPRHLVLLRRCGRSPRSAGPSRPRTLAKFYPNSVLVTGYDILFFWVARMMMFGLYAMDGAPPFRHIALHGMVRDEYGKKMSKSFGNAVDPLDWMDDYGSDALRFTLATRRQPRRRRADRRGLGPGLPQLRQQDLERHPLRADERRHGRGRTAATGRSCRRPTAGSSPGSTRSSPRSTRSTRTTSSRSSADALYHFAWDEVFDWYVELSKTTFLRGRRAAEVSGRVLGQVLDAPLRLLHPIVPFVTETLWTTLTGGESVVDARLAGGATPASSTDAAEAEIDRLQQSSPRSAASAPTRASSPARRSRPA